MFYSPYYRYPFYTPYYNYYGGYNYNSSINAIGSQIGYQNLVNTGNMAGVNQIYSPTQIW